MYCGHVLIHDQRESPPPTAAPYLAQTARRRNAARSLGALGKRQRRWPWWRRQRDLEGLVADNGIEPQMVSHGERRLAHPRAVPDHVVVMLKLCTGRGLVVDLAHNVEGLPRDVLPAHHGVCLHAVHAVLGGLLHRTNGSPASLLASKLTRALGLRNLVLDELPLLALEIVQLLTIRTGDHALFAFHVLRAPRGHVDGVAHILVAEVAA
mmetsp:Transcript_3695/g.7947  ORF Transcript_3695/g.7947 Transcript_3695/m.7947 type:complete len:209 (+) Transcript_3695:8-634(+)